ncbi:MAG: TrkA family potassium uptake protein [Planctomycetes bacterium]|nr:TrkA family potassium uptake protein [Planctomycetota bacterium]
MTKSFCFCGLSTFSYRAATSLFAAGKEVLAIDRDQSLIQKIRDSVSNAVCADVRDREVLRGVGAFACDVAVMGLPKDFGAMILTVHFFRQQGTKRIIAEVRNQDEGEAVKVVGATEVIFPERDAADRLVKNLTLPGLVEHFALSQDAGIIEVQCPRPFVGKTVIELNIRQEYGVTIVGIQKNGSGVGGPPRRTVIAPDPATRFEEGDIMLVLGATENLTAFAKAIAKL